MEVASPSEAKMPKALLKMAAKGTISTRLRKPAMTFIINANFAKRLAKKTLPMSKFKTNTVAKTTKEVKKTGCCRTGSRAGDQIVSPPRKIKEISIDVNPLRVKQVLIILLLFSPAPGRKRISPIPNPKLEKTVRSTTAEMVAEANPIAAVS